MAFGPMQGKPAPKQVNTAGGPPQGAPMGGPPAQGAPPGAQGGQNAPQQLDPAAVQNLAKALTPDNFKTFMQIFGAIMLDTYSLIQKSGGGQGGPQGPQNGPPGPQGGIMGGPQGAPPGAGSGAGAPPSGAGGDQGM